MSDGPPRTAAPPVDLRLVPAAAAVWAGAGIGVGLTPRVAVLGAIGLLAVAGVVVERTVSRSRAAPGPRAGSAPAPVRSGRPRHRAVGATATAVALALVAAAVCLAVVAVAQHARTSGPWGDLVRTAATVRVVAVVRDEPVRLPPRVEGRTTAGARVVIQVREVTGRGETVRSRAPVLVLGPESWLGVRVGDPITATGRLAPTERGDDVVALLVVGGEPQAAGSPSAVARAVATLRAGLMVASADLPGDAAGLVPGITIGDTSRLPSDLEDAMRAVSLTHLTAVSGAHVAIIVGSVLALTGWLRTGPRALLAGATLVAFVLVVHPGPSVLRAAAMGAVAITGLVVGRPGRAVPALAASVIVLVLLDPWIARQYGFALSVLATAGLVLLAPPLAAWLSAVLPRGLAYAVAIPAAAQAACGPVLVLLSPGVAVYGVPANLLAAPAVAPATVLGVVATVLAPWWPDAAVAMARLSGVFAWWIARVARRFADLPAAVVPWPGGVGGAALLAALTVVAFVLALAAQRRAPRTRRRAIALVLVLLVLAAVPGVRRAVVGVLPSAWPPDDWAVVMCDVGQGTAVAVRSGPRSAVVLDAGPPGDAAARCLDALGVDRLDLVILTHLHDDHVGGLPRVLAGREVTEALVSPYDEPALAGQEVSVALASHGVLLREPRAGAGGRAGDVRWDVLWPTDRALAAASGADGTSVNDMSLAVLLRSPRVSVLALGDLETTAQAGLATSVRRAREVDPTAAGALGQVDVVVMAHHGSARQDPGLARLVGADVALVSVGADNAYGHPAPGAVALYEGAGAAVLRTDRCGAVAVLADPLAVVSACGPDPAADPGE